MAQLLVTRLAERVRQVAELQDSNSGLKLALFDSQTELKETLTSLDASQRASVMAQQAGIDLKADADRQIVELKAERDGEFWRGVWWGGGSVAAIWGIVEFLKWVFGKK
jgi:hypothetical protein